MPPYALASSGKSAGDCEQAVFTTNWSLRADFERIYLIFTYMFTTNRGLFFQFTLTFCTAQLSLPSSGAGK